MAEKIGAIYWDLDVDTNKFHRGLKNAQGDVGSLKTHMESATRASQALLAGFTIAAAGAVAFGVVSVKAFQESENGIAQTNAVLKSTGGIAGVTADQVTKLATALQKNTSYSDEQVRSVENMALTFTSIGKKIFPQATKAALDMAVALNHGLTPKGNEAADTMKLLGKAMQDPDAGLGALKKVGVNVDELKKQFEGLTSKAEKQRLILKELNAEYGGSAQSAAQTYAGKIQNLKNRFNDLQEKLGGFILKGLEPLMDAFDDFMDKVDDAGGFLDYFKKILKDNEDLIYPLAGAIVVALIPAFISLGASIWTALAPLLPFIAAGALLGVVVQGVVDKMGGWQKVWDTVQPKIQPIVDWWNETLIPTLKNIWDWLKSLGDKLGWLVPVWSFLYENTKKFVELMWGIITDAVEGMKQSLMDLGFSSEDLKYIFIALVAIGLFPLIAAFGTVLVLLAAVAAAFKIVEGALWLAALPVRVMTGAWNAFLDVIHAIGGALSDLAEQFGKVGSAIKKIPGQMLGKLWDSVSGDMKVQPFADGGQMRGGRAALVGERGPELIFPSRSGYVATAQQTSAMMGGRQGSTQIQLSIDVSGVTAMTRPQAKEFGAYLVDAVNDDLKKRGVELIGGGHLSGGF